MKQKKSSFPKSLLNQINEFSSGGFMLFNLNEHGKLEIHSKFDNPLASIAMQHYIDVWMKALEVSEIEKNVELLNPKKDEEPPY